MSCTVSLVVMNPVYKALLEAGEPRSHPLTNWHLQYTQWHTPTPVILLGVVGDDPMAQKDGLTDS
jgi:hypothetical protein